MSVHINFYDRSRYRKEFEIEKTHKVKYALISTEQEFEMAIEELDSTKLKSITSDKKGKTTVFKKKFNLYGHKAKRQAKFKALCKEYLRSTSPTLKIDSLTEKCFLVAVKNLHKVSYIEDEYFSITWVHNDIIYKDELIMEGLEDGDCNVYSTRLMKVPTNLLKNKSLKADFKNGWKIHVKEISHKINHILDL